MNMKSVLIFIIRWVDFVVLNFAGTLQSKLMDLESRGSKVLRRDGVHVSTFRLGNTDSHTITPIQPINERVNMTDTLIDEADPYSFKERQLRPYAELNS